MAKMEEESPSSMPDPEKQSICHLATMLMEVGMSLSLAQDDHDDGNDGDGGVKRTMDLKPSSSAKKMKK